MELLYMTTPDIRSPHYFFKKSLNYFKEGQLYYTLQSIDAAIIFSNSSPFYIYQKIRFLYNLDTPENCSNFIVSQLEYLYKHSSLYILCRSIDYLVHLNSYDLNSLASLLACHQIPSCLADYYHAILVQKDKCFFKQAQKALIQDDYTLCLSYCDLYLKLHPVTPKISKLQAYSHHILGHLHTAKKYYLQSLELDPNNAESYNNIGLISMELGDYDTAICYFQKASTLNPDNLNYQLHLGECYYIARRLADAIHTYENIAQKFPTNLQNYFNLSHTYKKMCKNRLSKRYAKIIQKQLKTPKST